MKKAIMPLVFAGASAMGTGSGTLLVRCNGLMGEQVH